MSVTDEEDHERESVSIGNKTVTLGDLVGSGAEGGVYRVKGSPSDAVKIFSQDRRAQKEAKVRAMIDKAPSDPTYVHSDVRSIVWPTEIVTDPSTGSFMGYQMPYKDLDQAENARRYAHKELQWDESDEEKRLRIALNFARVVKAIHRQGHAMGDYNHQNILIEDEVVSLIDCDAFHIKGAARSYSDDTFFPRYAPPEGRGDNIEQVRKSDRFQLGVHIFQLLMEGFHPYQGQGADAESGDYATMIRKHPFVYDGPHRMDIGPHDRAPDYEQLPDEVRNLFSDCFSEMSKGPGWGRPKAKTWVNTLEDFVNTGDKVGTIDPDTLWGDSDDNSRSASSDDSGSSGGSTSKEGDNSGSPSVDIEEDLGW